MKINRLVLGTTNPGKITEWVEILKPIISVLPISAFSSLSHPQETGETFSANARQKATHYARLTHEYVLSEDGGYQVDALGGAPGVNSRRILPGGKDGTDQDLINYVLTKLQGVPLEKRTVKLTCVAAIADPQGKIIFQSQASHAGIVALKPGPVLIPGYPFRSIHYLPRLKKTYAELTPSEHQKYSHKRRIAQKLAKFLIQIGN